MSYNMFCPDKISHSPQSQKCRSSGLGEENCKIHDNLCFATRIFIICFCILPQTEGLTMSWPPYRGTLCILEEYSIGVMNMAWESDQGFSLVLTPAGCVTLTVILRLSFLICKMKNGIYSCGSCEDSMI